MTRRALVVGGSGFLGRHIVAALADAYEDTTVLSRRHVTGVKNSHVIVLDKRVPPRVQFARALAEIQPDTVVNAAGEVWQGDEELLRAANVTVPEQLAMAMAETRGTARLIHLGSSLEYGPLPSPAATSESCPTTPSSSYGRSKLSGTQRILEIADIHVMDVVVLRVFNAIGAGMSPFSLLGRTVRTLAEARRQQRAAVLSLVDLAQYRDYVDARDVADAVLAAATCKRLPRTQIVNIGSAVPRTAEEIVRGLAETSGVDYQLTKVPAANGNVRSTDAGWQLADTSLARNSLHWSADRAMPDTLRWIWSSEWTGRQDPLTMDGAR